MDNRHFILKTDHMNLTYLNVTLTGKVLRWKLYLQDKDFHLSHVPGMEVHQFVSDALSRLCENLIPPKPVVVANLTPRGPVGHLAALQPKQKIPSDIFVKIAKVHNTNEGHWGITPTPYASSALTHDRRVHSASVESPSLYAPIHLLVIQPIRARAHRPRALGRSK